MDGCVNVGLVGYKFMGKAHSNALKRINMFFDLPAKVGMKVICGRDERWVRESQVKFGWDECSTSWREMVARRDIDAVDITAPSDGHKEIAIAAAGEGKHVFCEKPLALNLADAREILEAAVKAKVRHQIGFNYRFAPAVILARKLIDEGRIGTIYHVRARYLQDWIMDPEFPLVWRLQKSVAGSGSLGDLGAHFIDITRYLTCEFKRVIGHSKTFVGERPIVDNMIGLSGKAAANAPKGKVDVDDATVFLAEFGNGGLGVFEASRFAAGHKNDMSFEVNGSKGSIRFEFERMNELQYFSFEDDEHTQGYKLIQATEPAHPYMGNWWPAGHVLGYENTFVHELYEFLNCVLTGKGASPDFADGVRCSQVIEAVDLSIGRKAWVDVDSL
ncbi:MAG: Gfo/Idh/MocA family oxidoreductase [Oscillospiraceae bacterium]|nr:Gfo/Idh/MocA family oxidoreductase [Oscillospiraceae bacterium]